MGSTTYRTTRGSLWGPPATFFTLAVIVLTGAQQLGEAIAFAVFAAVSGYWLVRCIRARVELNDQEISVHGQARTRTFNWSDIRAASAVPMRTASPFKNQFPYVCLGLELADGRAVRFEEVAASASNRALVEDVVNAVNRRLGRS